MPPAARQLVLFFLVFVCGVAFGTMPHQSADAKVPPSPAPQPQKPAPVATPAPDEPAARSLAPLTSPGRRGPESNELRSLRIAESDMFPDLLGEDDPGMADRDSPSECDCRNGGGWARRRAARTWDDPTDSTAPSRGKLTLRRHPRVEKYVHYFSQTTAGRRIFLGWLQRSGRYREIFTRALKKKDMPEELMAVAFIESGCSPVAVSPAGAVGMWQFMPKTARAYGLAIERGLDERKEVWKSTNAAVEHLADLKEYFQSWDLALAAYNMGYKRLTERLDDAGVDDYWQLADTPGAMPRETVLYVPKVLAVAALLRNLELYGFEDVKYAAPLEAAELEVPGGVRLSLLARAAGTSLRRIQDLNPHVTGDVVPPRGKALSVRVPAAGLTRAAAMLPRLIDEADTDRADAEVSADFDWGKDELFVDGASRLEKTANNAPPAPWRTRGSLRGMARKEEPVPFRRRSRDLERRLGGEDEAFDLLGAQAPVMPKDKPQILYYRTTRRDTLASIAKTFGVKPSEVLHLNRFRSPAQLKPGTLIRLKVSSAVMRGLT